MPAPVPPVESVRITVLLPVTDHDHWPACERALEFLRSDRFPMGGIVLASSTGPVAEGHWLRKEQNEARQGHVESATPVPDVSAPQSAGELVFDHHVVFTAHHPHPRGRAELVAYLSELEREVWGIYLEVGKLSGKPDVIQDEIFVECWGAMYVAVLGQRKRQTESARARARKRSEAESTHV